MNLLAQVAQVAVEHQALYTYGPLGVICAWLMWRDERRAIEKRTADEKISGDFSALGHRIDGLSKALLVDMTERETCGMHTRRYAQEELARIDSRETRP